MRGSSVGFLRATLLCLAVVLPWAPLAADERSDRVDALFARWDREDSPGCALGVIQDGELTYSRGYGCANLEYGIPIDSKSVFRIGSTSKQFTAACVLLLEGEGKLDLDEDIRKYVPEMRSYYEGTVTIRHLLHHTSGIRDYLTLASLAGKEDISVAETLALIARQERLNFAPGEEHLYSNSGYFLLGVICERAGGASLRQIAEQKIFGPLGMKQSHFHDDHTEVVPRRASGYSFWSDRFRISMTTLDQVGDGGVFTTVDDLLLWDRNFYEPKIGKKTFWERMLTTGKLNSGKELRYACGLVVRKHRGLDLIAHGGAFVGFRAEMIRFPRQRFSVICLANVAEMNPSSLALKVAEIYLEDELGTVDPPQQRGDRGSPPEPTPKVRPRGILDYVGVFYSRELDTQYTVTILDGDLWLHPAAGKSRKLIPFSKDEFRALRLSFRFTRGADRKVNGFEVDAGRIRGVKFERQ